MLYLLILLNICHQCHNFQMEKWRFREPSSFTHSHEPSIYYSHRIHTQPLLFIQPFYDWKTILKTVINGVIRKRCAFVFILQQVSVYKKSRTLLSYQITVTVSWGCQPTRWKPDFSSELFRETVVFYTLETSCGNGATCWEHSSKRYCMAALPEAQPWTTESRTANLRPGDGKSPGPSRALSYSKTKIVKGW